MPRKITLDFTGAPPKQGGGGRDYVPPGEYAATLQSLDAEKSKAGKPMLKATLAIGAGEFKGRQLVDYFIIDGEKKFPMQRLHAMFLAFNLPVQEKKLSVDLDLIVGKSCKIQVTDEIQAATDQYKEQTNSKIVAYHTLSAHAAAPKAAAVEAAPEPVAAPEAGKPEPEEAEELAVAAPVASVAGEPAEVEDLDDLFK